MDIAFMSNGFDVAMSLLQIHDMDLQGRIAVRKQLKGDQVLTYFANLAPCVAHQAGIGAHTALQWQQRSR